MSTGMSLKEATDTIKWQNEYIVQISKEKCELQAKIDSLMLEYCPDEMTQDQIERWEECQSTYVSSVEPPKIKTSDFKFTHE